MEISNTFVLLGEIFIGMSLFNLFYSGYHISLKNVAATINAHLDFSDQNFEGMTKNPSENGCKTATVIPAIDIPYSAE